MGTINGIGTVHSCLQEVHPDGSQWSTVWFTLFWLPVVPLRRERIVTCGSEGTWSYSYITIEKGPLRFKEVLLELVVGWLIRPTLLFAAPLLIALLLGHLFKLSEGSLGLLCLGALFVIGFVHDRLHARRFKDRRDVDLGNRGYAGRANCPSSPRCCASCGFKLSTFVESHERCPMCGEATRRIA